MPRSESSNKLTGDVQPLSTHSRLGGHSTATKIAHSIATLMCNVDSRHKRVTAMTLRASFAISMLHQCRNCKLATDVSEEKFLEVTANEMINSVKQLRVTHAAC